MSFVALLIVCPWGYAAIPLLAAGVALVGYTVREYDLKNRFDVEDGLWLLALSGFSVVWLADVLRTGVWPVPRGSEGLLLPFWPILAAGLLFWLRCYPPSLRGWWLGLIVGTLGAALIAGYERFWLDVARADNGMNAIPFGNIALLLGALSLVSMLGLVRDSLHCSAWWVGLLGLAAVGGLLASILSGTRGGWIALPALGWVVYRTFHSQLFNKRLRIILGFIGFILLGVTAMPQSGVMMRLALAVEEVDGYFSSCEKNTSVGLRLEMWHAGIMLFQEKPLVGWGEGLLQEARDAEVAEGDLYRGVSRYDQLHSDVIDTAARRGIVGLLALAGLYAIPLLLFTRHLRASRDSQVRIIALSGVIVVIAFIDFGLSQSMLRDARGLAGYLGLSVICWAMLKAKREDGVSRRNDSRA